MNLFDLVTYFAIVGLVIIAIGIAFLRLTVVEGEPVTFRSTSPEAGSRIVGEFILGVEDDIVGFPSGNFAIDGDKTTETTVVAREWMPDSVGWKVVFATVRIPWVVSGIPLNAIRRAATARGSDEALVVFIIGQILRLIFIVFLIVYLLPILIFAVLLELIARPLMRSEITVVASKDGDDCTIETTFRGLTARLVRKRLITAFSPVALPISYLVVT